MRNVNVALAAGALFAILTATPAGAEQHGTPAQPHHPEPKAGAPATPAPTPGPGTHGGGMPMMDMCRQMMGGATGMPMQGMPMMQGMPADPKQRAAMLEMHGEMMKTMGDVMMKHARRMHGPKGAN